MEVGGWVQVSLGIFLFQKKSLDEGWVGGVNTIQVFFGFFEFFLTLQSP